MKKRKKGKKKGKKGEKQKVKKGKTREKEGKKKEKRRKKRENREKKENMEKQGKTTGKTTGKNGQKMDKKRGKKGEKWKKRKKKEKKRKKKKEVSKNPSHGLHTTSELKKLGRCRWQCCNSLRKLGLKTELTTHCGNLKSSMSQSAPAQISARRSSLAIRLVHQLPMSDCPFPGFVLPPAPRPSPTLASFRRFCPRPPCIKAGAHRTNSFSDHCGWSSTDFQAASEVPYCMWKATWPQQRLVRHLANFFLAFGPIHLTRLSSLLGSSSHPTLPSSCVSLLSFAVSRNLICPGSIKSRTKVSRETSTWWPCSFISSFLGRRPFTYFLSGMSYAPRKCHIGNPPALCLW